MQVFQRPMRLRPIYWMMCLMLTLAFFLGGGSRPDIQSLIILRPLAALILGYSFYNLTLKDLQTHPYLLSMALATAGLVALHLVPLPPTVWMQLPGRTLIAEIDAAAGLGAQWRPLSLVPSATWNSLFALIPPIASLLLIIQLNQRERRALLPAIVGLGIVSSLIGLTQVSGPKISSFYFYQFNSDGAAGLFANRNHHAAFLATLFPILAAYASKTWISSIDVRLRGVISLAIGTFLVPLILVVGSRTGILLMLIGVFSTFFIYRVPSSSKIPRLLRPVAFWSIIIFIGATIAAITINVGRALALDRMMQNPIESEARFKAWHPILEMAGGYFPIGSGLGTFREVYRVYEPSSMLNIVSFGHAHNDPLELLVTGGLPALLLLGAAITAYSVAIIRWWPRRKVANGELIGAGLWGILILGTASLTDYPLRTPALACLLCVLVGWVATSNEKDSGVNV